MTKFLTQVNNLVWGMPLILLLLGTGIYFTTHLKFIQFVRLKKAFSLIFKKNENHEGDVSSFQALCTALSSTIGTGNIVGGSNCDFCRWSWRIILDVDFSFLWYGH